MFAAELVGDRHIGNAVSLNSSVSSAHWSAQHSPAS
jgi:hypothetical protein